MTYAELRAAFPTLIRRTLPPDVEELAWSEMMETVQGVTHGVVLPPATETEEIPALSLHSAALQVAGFRWGGNSEAYADARQMLDEQTAAWRNARADARPRRWL